MSYLDFVHNLITKNLFFHEVMHGLLAIPFALLYWKKTGKVALAFVVVIVTYVLDLDHLIDYFLFYGFHFNLFEFVDMRYFEISQRAIVPLHAWEWIFLLRLVSLKRGWKSFATALILGMIPHLVLDTFVQSDLWFYSIIHRAFIDEHGFLR